MLETKTIAATGPQPGIRERLAPMLSSRAGRRGLWILGGGVVAAGLATNWSWLTAIGIAPVLLAAAPCLAMCALGLCAMGRNSSCSKSSTPTGADAPSATPRVVAANTNDLDARPAARVVTATAAPMDEAETEAPPATGPAVLANETTTATETEAQPTEERKLTHA